MSELLRVLLIENSEADAALLFGGIEPRDTRFHAGDWYGKRVDIQACRIELVAGKVTAT